MDYKLISYLISHPHSSLHRIAKAMNTNEKHVFSAIRELSLKGLVSMTVLPLGNHIESDCSCYYSVRWGS